MSYRYRSMPVISRDNGAMERHENVPSWVENALNNLDKTSAKSKQEDYSLYDQLNQILGNKSKYSTVEEAVEDMRKRTGLSSYLEQLKTAQQQPVLFSSIPEMKHFIDNYVEARPGTSVEAVIHDLLKIKSVKDKLPKSDDVPEDVKRYINDMIASSKGATPTANLGEDLQLGKVDLSVDDGVDSENSPFRNCEPHRR